MKTKRYETTYGVFVKILNIFDLLYTVDMVTLPDSYYQPTPPADINEDSVVNNLDIFEKN